MSQDRDLRRLKTLEALAAEQAGTPEGELSAQRAQESRARLGLPPPRATAPPPPPRPGRGGRPKGKPRGEGKPKGRAKVSLTPEGAALAAMVVFGLGLFVLGGEYAVRRDGTDEDEGDV